MSGVPSLFQRIFTKDTLYNPAVIIGGVVVLLVVGTLFFPKEEKEKESLILPPLPQENSEGRGKQGESYEQQFATLSGELTAAEATKNEKAIGTILYKLVKLHERMQMPETEMTYLTRLLEINLNKKDYKSSITNYNRMGFLSLLKSESDKAIEFFEKALTYNMMINDRLGVAMSYHNIAEAQTKKGLIAKASVYFLKALENYARAGDKQGMADTYHSLGRLYYLGKRFDEAEEFEAASLDMNIQISNKNNIVDNYVMLGQIYQQKKDSKNGCRSWSEAFKMLNSPEVPYLGARDATKEFLQTRLEGDFCKGEKESGFGLR
jgi:tetratricopeptide (TPR) repeat protein